MHRPIVVFPLVLWTVASSVAVAQEKSNILDPIHAADRRATENLVLVTLDGLRFQELFSGAEELLIDGETGGVREPKNIRRKYWRDEPIARREALMPFFWQVVARKGQVFGAPEVGSSALVTNGRYFSYPGYQEILCGFPDEAIDSNDKKQNQNVTVLEWLHRREEFAGRIAAFASWDVFPYIINSERSGIYVNAGWQDLDYCGDDFSLQLVRQLSRDSPHYWDGVRFDAFTTVGALAYIRQFKPRVLYLALSETDDWCHEGRYDLYLEAADMADRHLRQLWQYLQESEHYGGNTSIVITTDHGRGDGREGWKNHSSELPGSERVWMAVMGPDTPSLGLRENVQVTQAQTAATAAALLGYDYAAFDDRVAPPLPGVLGE